MMATSLCPFNLPSFFSTVTPGQLPTYWFAPVKALNNVVLPQFGLPASAIVIAMISLLIFLTFHAIVNIIQLSMIVILHRPALARFSTQWY